VAAAWRASPGRFGVNWRQFCTGPIKCVANTQNFWRNSNPQIFLKTE
jgi:hypothetical protein